MVETLEQIGLTKQDGKELWKWHTYPFLAWWTPGIEEDMNKPQEVFSLAWDRS